METDAHTLVTNVELHTIEQIASYTKRQQWSVERELGFIQVLRSRSDDMFINIPMNINADEVAQCASFLKDHVCHDTASSWCRRRVVFVQVREKLRTKLDGMLCNALESSSSDVFVFLSLQTNWLSAKLKSFTILVRWRRPPVLDAHPQLGTLLERYLCSDEEEEEEGLRAVLLHVINKGIRVRDVARCIIMLKGDTIALCAEMEHASLEVNRDLFVLEKYMPIIRTEIKTQMLESMK